MTNSQPEDITARLEDIDNRLEQLGDEIDLIRTIQDGVRRETRANSQSLARLERTVANLADIARLHQQGLRASQQNIDRIQQNIDRIWEYLLRQGGNGNTTSN